MKWMSVYLAGYLLVLGGVVLALWKLGVWDSVDSTWRWIIGLVAAGIGLMIAVGQSGRKENIEIDTK